MLLIGNVNILTNKVYAMKVLVTGGAGYIGSHTAMALKEAGHEPVVLDSLVQGHEWAVKYGPLEVGDIGDEGFVRTVCSKHKPEAVIHFAAFIEVGESVQNPEKYFENNTEKAKVLFSTVAECGVDAAVFSSTAAVYGTPVSDAPIDEAHLKVPINPYGESKLQAERFLRSLDGQGLRSVALRYFNAAGAAPLGAGLGEAHQSETHLIPNILRASLGYSEGGMKVFGTDYETRDGTALRDYIHVLDLASAHIAALHYMKDGGATDACNLGTGKGSTVMEVIKAAEAATGKPVPHTLEGRREGDPPVLIANADRAKEKLGWTPKYSLDDCVRTAFEWHGSDAYKKTVGIA